MITLATGFIAGYSDGLRWFSIGIGSLTAIIVVCYILFRKEPLTFSHNLYDDEDDEEFEDEDELDDDEYDDEDEDEEEEDWDEGDEEILEEELEEDVDDEDAADAEEDSGDHSNIDTRRPRPSQ